MLAVYYSYIVYSTPNDNDEYSVFWVKHDTIPMITIGVIDFILNISLLYLFIDKLKQILQVRLLFSSDVYRLINDDINSQEEEDHDSTQSRDLLRLMTRHAILFGIAIITNQVWYITVLVQYNQNINFYLSHFCFRTLENTANVIVLFLGLKANWNCYMCLCGCCHRNIQTCFIKAIHDQTNESGMPRVSSRNLHAVIEISEDNITQNSDDM